jgi:hypothetical protein
VSRASLFTVVLILADERRDDQLAQLHEQLNLELAILSEQKTAKVIQFAGRQIDQGSDLSSRSAI